MPPSAVETLDRDFLTLRSRLLDVAAALDRLDRAEGSIADDPRMRKIADAIEVLASPDENRTEQIQMIFSDEA